MILVQSAIVAANAIFDFVENLGHFCISDRQSDRILFTSAIPCKKLISKAQSNIHGPMSFMSAEALYWFRPPEFV